ncbi:hypothetical protein EKK58_04925 [Candidatus Dependentiae bacterium]|nr:MAG: hypothetical protein EKK58_04925 [Candidatus Dependentiae bacterium]
MFIHERNNMSVTLKKIYITVILASIFAVERSLGNENTIKSTVKFPLLSMVHQLISHGNNAKIGASFFLVLYLCNQYYNHKTRPKDEDISEEGYNRRWFEIIHGNYSTIKKIQLLISFIDDFYIFGRRAKSVEITTKTKNCDGAEVVTKEKKAVIKGTGPIAFLYDKVFDGLENTLKSIGQIATFVLIVDRLLSSEIDFLLKPTKAEFSI